MNQRQLKQPTSADLRILREANERHAKQYASLSKKHKVTTGLLLEYAKINEADAGIALDIIGKAIMAKLKGEI